MILKVCGLKYEDNIQQLEKLSLDMIGLIFYQKSARCVGEVDTKKKTDRVGVFVNELVENILDKVVQFDLDFVQLHGAESPKVCENLMQKGVRVIKAFSIDDEFDFSLLESYVNTCSYFLFDTKGAQPGGNGTRFNWSKLKEYKLNVPFLLSGGIELTHANEVNELYQNIEQMIGVDINSRFEIEPGLKDVNQVKKFKNLLDENLK